MIFGEPECDLAVVRHPALSWGQAVIGPEGSLGQGAGGAGEAGQEQEEQGQE